MYKSISFLRNVIKRESGEIENAQKVIDSNSAHLVSRGERILRQFVNFVNRNKDLFDDDFIGRFSHPYKVIELSDVESKKAFRVKISFISNAEVRFIIVPYLFIENVEAYRRSRTVSNKFGKDTTMKQVKQHYDGEIEKLMEEVKRLEQEKSAITTDDGDWS